MGESAAGREKLAKEKAEREDELKRQNQLKQATVKISAENNDVRKRLEVSQVELKKIKEINEELDFDDNASDNKEEEKCTEQNEVIPKI